MEEMENRGRGQGLAITSMILGIIGLILACLVVGIVPCLIGLIMGIVVLAQRRPGKGMAIAGIVTSTIGLLIFIVLIIGISASTKAPETKVEKVELEAVEETVTEAEARTSRPAKTEAAAQAPETEAQKQEDAQGEIYHVGDVIETKYDKLTYLSCDPDFKPSSEFFQPDSGNKLVRLEFEYENVGKSDQSISFYSFTGYADGYKVEPWYFENDDISGTISSGKKVKGAVYFEVPADAGEVTVEYDLNFWTSDKVVFAVE